MRYKDQRFVDTESIIKISVDFPVPYLNQAIQCIKSKKSVKTLFRPGFENPYSGQGGGAEKTPPWKIDHGVSDQNSFSHSQLYIYRDHISKRIGV